MVKVFFVGARKRRDESYEFVGTPRFFQSPPFFYSCVLPWSSSTAASTAFPPFVDGRLSSNWNVAASETSLVPLTQVLSIWADGGHLHADFSWKNDIQHGLLDNRLSERVHSPLLRAKLHHKSRTKRRILLVFTDDGCNIRAKQELDLINGLTSINRSLPRFSKADFHERPSNRYWSSRRRLVN